MTLREAMAAAAIGTASPRSTPPATRSCSAPVCRCCPARSRGGAPTLEAIVSLHLGLLAEHRDTLIERKAGLDAARAVSADARRVLDGKLSIADFDASLRGADHRLNPGTTADLVAATCSRRCCPGWSCVRVLVVAVSARMLAELAVADGHEVAALDRFGDVDLRAVAPGSHGARQRGAGGARR